MFPMLHKLVFLQGNSHGDNAQILVTKIFTTGPFHFTTANLFIIFVFELVLIGTQILMKTFNPLLTETATK